ncbi:helix-turn-helix domain-containing protein [Saccharothrix sp. SC076]|nr:helix-turn-helix domain-containing protein [Saccharothrix obliqua]
MYRVKAVAEMFDISPHTVYRLIKAGELDALKVGGSIRVPESALAVFREACAGTGDDATAVEVSA